MLFDRIDIRRLRRDIVSAAAQCREQKRALRRTWTRPMADEQRALARLAWRATELCILMARTRGRYHLAVAGADRDREAYTAKVAERVALDYTLAEDRPAATAEVVAS